jgi:hypothetical protein
MKSLENRSATKVEKTQTGLDSCLAFEDPPIVVTGKAPSYEGHA